MMILTLFVFRRLLLIVLSISRTVLCKQVIQGTFRAAQSAVFMLMKQYRVCSRPGCQTCAHVAELMEMDLVKQFKAKLAFTADKLEVDATLSDLSLGWTGFKIGVEDIVDKAHTVVV